MRKDNLLNWLIIGVNAVLLMFSYKFWCWALWLILLFIFLIYLGFYGITTKKLRVKEPFYKIKALLARLLVVALSLGGLYFYYWIGWYKIFLDIPAYLDTHYEVVEGVPTRISSVKSKSIVQVITINGVDLESHHLNLKPSQDLNKRFKIYYLPNSKFVMEIWVYDKL